METSNGYISGPHSRDYYPLLDEQADRIFAMRLAAHIREARGVRDGNADLANANPPERWAAPFPTTSWRTE